MIPSVQLAVIVLNQVFVNVCQVKKEGNVGEKKKQEKERSQENHVSCLIILFLPVPSPFLLTNATLKIKDKNHFKPLNLPQT